MAWSCRLHVLISILLLNAVVHARAASRALFSFDELRGVIVNAIHEDSRGYFWLGTEGGVWRGQNNGFEPFRELYAWGTGAQCFLEDDDGTLWIGTADGLRGADVHHLTDHVVPSPLDTMLVTALSRAPDGDLLVGTRNGLYRYRSQGAAAPQLVGGTANEVIFSIAFADDGAVWLAVEHAILRLANGSVSRMFRNEVGNGPNRILLADDGALWIGLRRPGGLYRWHEGHLERFGASDGLLNEDVNALLEAPTGQMWVATERGAFAYHGGRFEHIGREDGLINDDVHSLHIDREGFLWIGTFGRGVYQLRSQSIVVYDVEDGLNHGLVTDLVFLAEDRFLVSTIQGINLIGPGTHDADGVKDGIDKMLIDSAGTLWMTSRAGLTSAESLNSPVNPGVRIRDIVEAPDSGLLLGTSGGLLHYTGDTMQAVVLPPELGHLVHNLAAGADGRVLVATSQGLAHGVPGAWQVVMSGREILSMAMGREGVVWIGTRDTLLRWHDGQAEDMSTAQVDIGLVRDVACQADGTVWAATRLGLVRCRAGRTTRFTPADGLPSPNLSHVIIGPRDNLFVGTNQGLVRIDTRHFEPSVVPPLLVIQEIMLRGDLSPTDRDNVATSRTGRDLQVQLACLGWRSARGAKYQYRLLGRDDTWSTLSDQGLLRLGVLTPGAYVFEARAVNAEEQVSNVATLSFSMMPPWYRQPRFRMIVAFVGVIAFVLLILYIVQRGRARGRQLLLEEQLRRSQRMEAVGTLAAGVAHDFNNLLTAIIGYKDMAEQAGAADPRILEATRGIDTVADQGSGVIQALLAFSRNSPLTKHPIHVGRLVGDTMRLLRPIIPSAIDFVTDLDEAESMWIEADPSQLQQVLLNLVVNARDSMPDGGRLLLRVSRIQPPPGHWADFDTGGSGQALLVVEDEGVGMTEDISERMFDPFFTTKARAQGTGLGLAIVHGIVEDLGGSIHVDSSPGVGTTIMIALRCTAAQGTDDERGA